MNLVPALGLVFDPNHESPDLIDQRPPNDPTRQQTGGPVPMTPLPGEPQPVLDDTDASIPVFNGWNIWDVLQSQVPIEPTPGTLDQQLADFVRDAVHFDSTTPIAKVSSAAAGGLVKARAAIPELAGPLHLGVDNSQVLRRTIAFQFGSDPNAPDDGTRISIPWPRSLNAIVDAVYRPAPGPTPDPPPPALPLPVPAPADEGDGSSGLLMVGLGVGLMALLLSRGRRR